MKKKSLFKEKVHVKAIFTSVGYLLHVPAFMCFFSMLIAMFFKENDAVIPLFAIGAGILILGQLFFKVFYKSRQFHLWDAMIAAGVIWFLTSFFGSFVFYWIGRVYQIEAFKDPINCLFESFSGFTTTGLTIIEKVSLLPKVLVFWRSFSQWIGGIGLIIFLVSMIDRHYEDYRLFIAEGKTEKLGKNIAQTTQTIFAIYIIYTVLCCILLYFSGMPFWHAINHSMTALSTGGFSSHDQNISSFNIYSQIILMIFMMIGATGFLIHYKILRKAEFSFFISNKQNRLLYIFFFFGSLLIVFLNFKQRSFFQSAFYWISSLSTTGFVLNDLLPFPAVSKILFILAMTIGGSSGSSASGIKIRRFADIFKSIHEKLFSFTKDKEKKVLKTERTKSKNPNTDSALPLSERTKRLYGSCIIFSLWIFTLFIGWILLSFWMKDENSLNVLFTTANSLSNCGLTTSIPSLLTAPKIIIIFLMWIGRLEIIPVLILFSSCCLRFFKND